MAGTSPAMTLQRLWMDQVGCGGGIAGHDDR
jgi:hypothetical protein